MSKYDAVNLGFKAFQVYSALKLHFGSEDYDFFKFRGKTSVKIDGYLKRPDRQLFHKLSYEEDPFGLLLANLCVNHDKWIGDIISKDGMEVFNSYRKNNEGLTYFFGQDLNKITKDDLKLRNGQLPNIIRMANAGTINKETMIVLIDILGLEDDLKKKYYNSLVFKPSIKSIIKYKPFVRYNSDKILSLLKEKWNTDEQVH